MSDKHSAGIRFQQAFPHILHIFQDYLILSSPVFLSCGHLSALYLNSRLQVQLSAQKGRHGGTSSAHSQIIKPFYYKAGPHLIPGAFYFSRNFLRASSGFRQFGGSQYLKADSRRQVSGIDNKHPLISQLFLYKAEYIAGS